MTALKKEVKSLEKEIASLKSRADKADAAVVAAETKLKQALEDAHSAKTGLQLVPTSPI